MPLPPHGLGSWVGIGLAALACKDQPPPLRSAVEDTPIAERATLSAGFVSHDTGGLRRVLDSRVIVQPPLPDSARQGAAAIDYVLGLAAGTSVAESRLVARITTPEGPFLFEQGTWMLRPATGTVYAPYTLRWRNTPAGWRVVLWRWGGFR